MSDRRDRYYSEPFGITHDHQKLAQRISINWYDNIELGAPGLDPKRPFGNSDLAADVSEILGRTVDYDEAQRYLFEMGYVLRAALKYWLGEITK